MKEKEKREEENYGEERKWKETREEVGRGAQTSGQEKEKRSRKEGRKEVLLFKREKEPT